MDGSSGGRENWPDSGTILKVQPTGCADRSYVSVKEKKKEKIRETIKILD